MAIRPIKPSQVSKKKTSNIPDFVIETFNEFIVNNWSGTSARIDQDSIVDAIVTKMQIASTSGLDEENESNSGKFRNLIFKDHCLDVEDYFREAGWKVYYDKPGYCESYSAYFIFSK